MLLFSCLTVTVPLPLGCSGLSPSLLDLRLAPHLRSFTALPQDSCRGEWDRLRGSCYAIVCSRSFLPASSLPSRAHRLLLCGTYLVYSLPSEYESQFPSSVNSVNWTHWMFALLKTLGCDVTNLRIPALTTSTLAEPMVSPLPSTLHPPQIPNLESPFFLFSDLAITLPPGILQAPHHGPFLYL